MSSQFGIVESDLHPDPIPDAQFDELTDYDADGEADVDWGTVRDKRELEFLSYTGGMYTEAANIALAKPHVIMFVVYGLHFRRAQIADAKVPEEVKDAYQAAKSWAKADGKRLLAAEGTITPAEGGGVQFTAPDSDFGMTALDRL